MYEDSDMDTHTIMGWRNCADFNLEEGYNADNKFLIEVRDNKATIYVMEGESKTKVREFTDDALRDHRRVGLSISSWDFTPIESRFDDFSLSLPLEGAPVLNTITDLDSDGNYIVAWSDMTGAMTYTLEEDNNAEFISPVIRYADRDSQYTVHAQSSGTWYYRVQASNVTQESLWSNIESITVETPPEGDTYEDDDACAAASAIPTDGTVQPHTFHDQGDADWVTFTAEAGATYVIQGSDVGPQVDLVPELHNSCSQPALPGDDLDFGQGFRLVWDCPVTGTYYLKVFNRDTAVYGEEAYYDLSIREQSGEGVAIVVAGHRSVPEPLMRNITYAANMAYRVFLTGGYDQDRIYYLHPDSTTDADGDGTSDVDAVSSSANLQQAITGWAADWVGPGTPVYLYLVDHGGDDLFYIDTWSDTVSAAELNGWLTELENSTGCEEINIIMEACESGSFIVRPASLSRTGRIVITASRADQTAYAYSNGQGAYFSNTFLSQLAGGADLWTAYTESRDALWAKRNVLNYQQPWLDDNGDGVADALDGDVARQRGLLSAFGSAVPWIAELSPQQQIEGYTSVITATIYDDGTLEEVWAEIYPPAYRPPDDPDSVQLIDVPQVRLTQTGAQTYRGTYGGFTEVGEYQVVVSARDDDQNHAVPQVTTVRTGWYVYLPLVLRAP
jgi:hypothetical protein